jgi:hypothetical protein
MGLATVLAYELADDGSVPLSRRLDLSRFSAAPGFQLRGYTFESQWAFPARASCRKCRNLSTPRNLFRVSHGEYLTELERHGPNGRHWNGITKHWEQGAGKCAACMALKAALRQGHYTQPGTMANEAVKP